MQKRSSPASTASPLDFRWLNTPGIHPTPLAERGYMREQDVLAVFPVGRSTWWEGVRLKRYPQPVKLSARVTAWRVADIRELLESVALDNTQQQQAR